jgi:hypothetical protein
MCKAEIVIEDQAWLKKLSLISAIFKITKKQNLVKNPLF